MITADFPNPPKPPMVECPHCSSMNEDDGRKNCRNCQKPMSGDAQESRAEAIARVVAEAPELTGEQLVKLRLIFPRPASARREAA